VMLEVDALVTAYGRSQVLFGVSFGRALGRSGDIARPQRHGQDHLGAIGHGMVRPRGGTILFEGKPLHGLPSYRVAQAGLGLVPEGRQVFPNLTVRETWWRLRPSARAEPSSGSSSAYFALFPQLAERRAHFGSQLSAAAADARHRRA